MAARGPRKVYRTRFRVPFEEISSNAALDWPLWKQYSLVAMFTAAALRAGFVPADALKRALDALGELRSYARTSKLSAEDQMYLQHLAIGAMESRGGETGAHLAYRAIEAWRLIGEWRAGRWPPPTPKPQPKRSSADRRLPDRFAHLADPG